VNINVYVMSNGMTGGEVFGLYLCPARGTIEFQDANPVRVRGEIVLGLEYRVMNFARVSGVHKTSPLIILLRVDECFAARATMPHSFIKIQI
jgi:hypothetical protein